ncbi:hypothetical protein B0H14DRAFT_2640767 [Mycena olivaceomarginata]|nr:hypothetical protein B0H14DRAFT_2640767 [Mycena olivaceomarginata]
MTSSCLSSGALPCSWLTLAIFHSSSNGFKSPRRGPCHRQIRREHALDFMSGTRAHQALDFMSGTYQGFDCMSTPSEGMVHYLAWRTFLLYIAQKNSLFAKPLTKVDFMSPPEQEEFNKRVLALRHEVGINRASFEAAPVTAGGDDGCGGGRHAGGPVPSTGRGGSPKGALKCGQEFGGNRDGCVRIVLETGKTNLNALLQIIQLARFAWPLETRRTGTYQFDPNGLLRSNVYDKLTRQSNVGERADGGKKQEQDDAGSTFVRCGNHRYRVIMASLSVIGGHKES